MRVFHVCIYIRLWVLCSSTLKFKKEISFSKARHGIASHHIFTLYTREVTSHKSLVAQQKYIKSMFFKAFSNRYLRQNGSYNSIGLVIPVRYLKCVCGKTIRRLLGNPRLMRPEHITYSSAHTRSTYTYITFNERWRTVSHKKNNR